MRRLLPFALGSSLLIWFSASFSLLAPAPPNNPDNLCHIFAEQPDWYDYARRSEDRWGTPIAIQMAFVYYESSFRSHARPARKKLLGFIPWSRPSSAFGYAQAVDPAWSDYVAATGDGPFVVRSHMKHALDFIGWYNNLSQRLLGIDLSNPRHLYYAYHEGHTGYRQQRHRNKPQLIGLAKRVASRADKYTSQPSQCETQFQCDSFYEFWPLCRVANG